MTRRSIQACLMSAFVAACAQLPPTDPSADLEQAAARQLLVTTRQEPGEARTMLGDPASFYPRRRGYGPTPEVDRTLDRIARDFDVRRVTGWYISAIGEYCEVFELRPDQSAEQLIERISADPSVELVQEMNVFRTQGVHYDDPLAKLQPALAELSIESAHEYATGRGVTVAVVDSSVDRRHLELRGKVRTSRNLIDDRAIQRPEVHGTAVAGVIGSAANNGEGIVGVAPDSRIASLRACRTVEVDTGRAECSSFSLAQAMETAIQMRADIVNLSLAGPYDSLLARLIDEATDIGMIVVAAAADAPRDDNRFPASHPRVLAAAASELSVGENAASNLLRAPGAEIMSTVPDDRYAFFSGNSMSAAYLAGVSALIRERHPDMRADELVQLLNATGNDRSINACRAIVASDGADADCAAEVAQ